VTSSERRTQRVRKAVEPPGLAKDDIEIVPLIAQRMGHDWPIQTAEEIWDELRSVSPMHFGMTYTRLEEMGGIQWPCPSLDHPGTPFLHSWLWEDPMPRKQAPFIPTEFAPPLDELTDEYPMRLTTGRKLDSYNTGVQSGGYKAPKRRGGAIEMAPEDGESYGLAEGEIVKITSRRGSIEAPVYFHRSLRPGLAFMPLHFPDETDVNVLTNDYWDPKAGTAEFKATAVRIEKVG
jgi:formate dehydrogenase major subunit